MSSRRPYQDYSSWQSYGTAAFWDELEATPCLAGELICQRLAKGLGAVNLSETCSADVASAILVATHGPAVGAFATDDVIQITFQWVKARPCMTFCTQVAR